MSAGFGPHHPHWRYVAANKKDREMPPPTMPGFEYRVIQKLTMVNAMCQSGEGWMLHQCIHNPAGLTYMLWREVEVTAQSISQARVDAGLPLPMEAPQVPQPSMLDLDAQQSMDQPAEAVRSARRASKRKNVESS